MKLIDISNIACIGYSAGGASSAEICIEDTRVKAGVNVNGVLYGDAYQKSITQPFLYINADYSNPKKAEIAMLGGKHVLDSIMRFYNKRKQLFFENSRNDFYELTVSNTTHHNFSDLALLDQTYCGRINPKRGLQITYEYIVSFLDKYLKEKMNTRIEHPSESKEYVFEIKSSKQSK